MRKFLFKISIFTLPLLFYFGINSAINYGIYSNQNVDLGQLDVLILGDSHPQKSINPEFLSNAKNISQLAEPYVLSYWKLKKILEFHHPDTLILGFAPHNIAEFNDLKFSKEKWAPEMFRRSYPIENFEEIENKISIDYKSYYKTLWKQIAFYPKSNHQNYIGQYSTNESSDVSDWKKIIRRHYYWDDKQLGVSELSILYLDSIVNISKQNKITLVLVNTPVHENYANKIPKDVKLKFEKLKYKYKDQAMIFDFNKKHNYPDTYFFNSDHLNEKGAKQFTFRLKSFIRE
ncbi:hypothetical protein [Psychroflexus aestuariivivens]|uniref:hypothetical protein n=1 Tax=Psychroflexus aestuariivivens TaxID=1795040 RepID=UPI000FDB7512|nr:hypothetical protein [Psychroflexus aestuariivivens]